MQNVVAHVVQTIHQSGGIEKLVFEHLKANPESTFIFDLTSSKNSTYATYPSLAAFDKQIVFLNKPDHLHLSTIGLICKTLKRLKIQAVFTHHIGPLLYAGLAAKLAKNNNVCHIFHDTWYMQEKKQQLLTKVLLKIIKPQTVAVANYLVEDLNKHSICNGTIKIHNGVDIERFTLGEAYIARKRLNLPQQKFLIGICSRIVPTKGHEALISSLLHLPNNYCLVIAGSGEYTKHLEQLVTRLNLQARCFFLGFIENTVNFYQSLDVFCLPSQKEGLPLTLLEAQSCGIPVIVSDVGGCKETICPLTGMVLEDLSPSSIAQTISIINKGFNKKTRDFILSNFSLSKMLKAYQYIEFN